MVRALSAHEAEIRDVLAELRGARIIAEHNPTTDNQRTVEICEERLDLLLEILRNTLTAA